MAKVAVRIGNAATISRFDASVVQQNIGMRVYVMPGACSFSTVVTKFTPVSKVPTPEICSDHR